MAEPGAGALRLADLAVRVGRRAWRTLPAGVRKDLEDRVFYVIFQKTRVENDAYGWRPREPEPAPRDGEAGPRDGEPREGSAR